MRIVFYEYSRYTAKDRGIYLPSGVHAATECVIIKHEHNDRGTMVSALTSHGFSYCGRGERFDSLQGKFYALERAVYSYSTGTKTIPDDAVKMLDTLKSALEKRGVEK